MDSWQLLSGVSWFQLERRGPPIEAHRPQTLPVRFLLEGRWVNNWAKKTRPCFFFRNLSTKYWLFHRDPKKWIKTIPIWLGSISSPIYSLTNQGPFFHCSTRIRWHTHIKETMNLFNQALKNLKIYIHTRKNYLLASEKLEAFLEKEIPNLEIHHFVC